MNAALYVNISIQTFGGIISLMIIVFMKFVRKKQNELDVVYVRFLICNTILLFISVMSWILDGKAGDIYHFLSLGANFFVFVFQLVLIGIVADYFILYIEEKGGKCRFLSRYLWAYFGMGMILVIISQFNDMFYLIDENNVYYRQKWFGLYMLILILGILVIQAILIWRRKYLNTKEMLAFTTFLIIPGVALILQTFFYGLVLVYIAITFVGIGIFIFIQSELARDLNEKELELEKIRTAIMLSQIQPHFLYNSLMGIKQLCETAPKEAAEALDNFSYFLRGNLDSLVDTRKIWFKKELEYVQNYLYLEKMRFGERIQVILEINYDNFMLPPITIQPIVENAISHGITKKEEGGTILIKSENIGDNAVITICDDGVGFNPEEWKNKAGAKTGIENVKSQLKLQCNGSLNIYSEKSKGTKIIIVLPQNRRTR